MCKEQGVSADNREANADANRVRLLNCKWRDS
jgi:hypothetical protein